MAKTVGKVRNRRKTARLKAKIKAKLRRAHGKRLSPSQRKKLKKKTNMGAGRTRLGGKARGKNRSARKSAR